MLPKYPRVGPLCNIALVSFPLSYSALVSLQPKEKHRYVNCIKTMRKEPSVTVAVKKREGQMDELFRGSQRRSEVNWGRDDRSPLRMRHTLLPLCVFFLPEKKKCSSGIVQRLMVALPGLQFSKSADSIPSDFQHNRVVKNADSSDARPFFPFTYLSQAVSLGYIKPPHSINPISGYMFGHMETIRPLYS